MSHHALFYPLFTISDTQVTVLAVHLDYLSEAMDRPNEEVFRALGDHINDRDHCRRGEDETLISPAAALKLVKHWKAQVEDNEEDLAVASSLINHLSPLARVEPGGFNRLIDDHKVNNGGFMWSKRKRRKPGDEKWDLDLRRD